MDLKLHTRSAWIKAKAEALGFMDCGIAKADFLEDEARYLEDWLARQKHGRMDYMSNHFDLRTDPRKLVPGAQSVIVLTMNYFPDQQQHSDAPKLSKYAYGRDYHKVIKKRLKTFLSDLNEQFGSVNGRGFVDSAPVMEKAWAQRAGVGWMGKHTNILSKKVGSFFFLAVLVVDLPLAYDEPTTDHCGSCTACIDACPTNAIEAPYQLDASKCISYFTIELKDALPRQMKGRFDGWMFGCDICQDVCPWNRFSKPHAIDDFRPKEGLLDLSEQEWHELTQERFDELFAGSAVKRTKYEGLMRNIRFLEDG
jgi:epoxyqueuosine reductase